MTNNKKNIDKLISDLDDLPEELIEAATDASEDIQKALEATHRKGQAPDGSAWKARQKAYPWPVNNKSGNLLRSYDVDANPKEKTITIQNTAAYAEYVNDQRPLMPVSEIPKQWVKEMQDALNDFIEDWNRDK